MNKRGHIRNAESWVCNSPLDLHSADFANLGRFADFSPVSHPKFAKNHESQTENPSVVDSARDAESSEKIRIKKPLKSFCFVWLSPNEESPLLFNHNLPSKADSQNLRGWLLRNARKSFGLPRSHLLARNDEFNRDSSLRLRFAQNDNLRYFAESTNKAQQTIEEIAVEVAEFLGDFGCETGLKSAKHSKSPKSPQDAPKTKLQTRDELT